MLLEILDDAQALYIALSPVLHKVVLSLVTLFAGFICGRIIDVMLYRALVLLKVDSRLGGVFGRRRYATATRHLIVRSIYVVTVLLALRQLGIVTAVLIIVGGILLMIASLSLVLGIVEFIPNLIARFEMRGWSVKDAVVLRTPQGTIRGHVLRISLLDAHIRRQDGARFLIPVRAFHRYAAKR